MGHRYIRDRGATKAIPREPPILVLIRTWRLIFVDLTIGGRWRSAHRALGGLGGLSLGMALYTITHLICFCTPLHGRFFIPSLIVYGFVYHCINGFVRHHSLHVCNTWFCTPLDWVSKRFYVTYKKGNERPNVRVVSIRSRNGVPSRKGWVANGQMTKASN